MKSFACTKCGGRYASSQSLWNHKQRCKSIIPPSDAGVKIFDNPLLTSPSINHQPSQEKCSSFPDITKPAKNPKLSAMIDILNIWKEAGEINEQVYKEVSRKIKSV